MLSENVLANLEARFGPVPADRQTALTALAAVSDESRLQALHRLSATCADVDAFVAALSAGA